MRPSPRDERNNIEVLGGVDQVLPPAVAMLGVFGFSGDTRTTRTVFTLNSALLR
jgi:hypothetical protein